MTQCPSRLTGPVMSRPKIGWVCFIQTLVFDQKKGLEEIQSPGFATTKKKKRKALPGWQAQGRATPICFSLK